MKNDSPAIRLAESSDATQVAELLTELGYPISGQQAAARLARKTESVFVAEAGGRLVGLLSVWSQLPIARAKPVARITAMVVRSDSRSQGIGQALMQRAIAWAREAGCEGIELTSGMRAERDRAHAFYEFLGYEKTSYRFWLPLD